MSKVATQRPAAEPPSLGAADIARQALKQLTSAGLPPTPSHYSDHYFRVAGVFSGELPSLTAATVSEPGLAQTFETVFELLSEAVAGLHTELVDFSSDCAARRTLLPTALGSPEAGQTLTDWQTMAEQLSLHVARAQREFNESRELLVSLQDDLRENQIVEQVDRVTRALNRRGLDIVLRKLVAKARRESTPLTVSWLGVTEFGALLAAHGREVGDRALQHLMLACRGMLTPRDAAARLDEAIFLLVFPETDAQGAYFVTERLRSLADRIPLRHDGQAIDVRFSAGVAQLEPQESAADLLARAQRYQALAERQTQPRVVGAAEWQALAPVEPVTND